VLGLISLRQRLLPLVSLRSLFGLPAQAADEQHRIVVVALPGGGQVGLVTDSVKEVLSVPRSQAEADALGTLARDAQLQRVRGDLPARRRQAAGVDHRHRPPAGHAGRSRRPERGAHAGAGTAGAPHEDTT
jgi:hypothetical protein